MILPTQNSTILIPLSLLTFILFSSLPFTSPYKQPHLMHSIKYDNNNSTFSTSNSSTMFISDIKKLRRLPHVFSKVIELPFDSDTDVMIEDKPEFLRFIAKEVDTRRLGDRVDVQVVEVHHGITRVVIRKQEKVKDIIRSQPLIDELDLNQWRLRLPSTACPELAKAVFENRRLVVTVPKNSGGGIRAENCKGGFKGNMSNLLVVR